MIFFIKGIFYDQIDEETHKQFIRFSKGTFENKAILNVRKGKNIKITCSFELVKDIVLFVASLAEKFEVNGVVLSKGLELERMLGKGVKKKNLFNFDINKELTSKEIEEISKNSYYMLFDCVTPGIILKIKKKLPKLSKKDSSKNDDKFCSLQLDARFWPQLHEEFLFDLPDFKKARITHKYIIDEIILPKEEKDFEKIRILAKRKGTIIRNITLDKEEICNKKEFIA